MPRQMVTPKITEVSGVDHPAHLAEGWLLMKALGEQPADLNKGIDMPDTEPSEADLFEKALADLPEPVRKALLDQQRDAAEAKAVAKALRDEREDARFEAVAKSLTHLPTEEGFAKSLRSLAEADPDAYSVVEKALRAANAAMAGSDMFKAIGSDEAAAASALGRLEGIAKALREQDSSLTEEQAFAKAASENPDLYNQHLAEV